MNNAGRIFLLIVIGSFLTGCSGSRKISRIHYIEEPVIIIIGNPPPKRPGPLPHPPVVNPEPGKQNGTGIIKKYRNPGTKERPRQNENKLRERTGDRTTKRGRTR